MNDELGRARRAALADLAWTREVDRAARRTAVADLARTREVDRARRIVETARDAFISIDADGIVEEWNLAAELLFGWSAEEAVGQLLEAMIIPTAQRSWHRQGMERMRAGGDPHILEQTLELIALRRDLSEVPVELTVWSVDDDRRSFSAFLRDISERREHEAALVAANAELEELNRQLGILSVTDPLTGAFNRRHLDTTLVSTCHDARRHGDHTAVLLLDVDHFKRVNDRFGHHRGDEVLRAVADRMASTLREGDTLGRWGGEEFVILLPRTDQQGAEVLAERARCIIADEPIGDQEDSLRVTVSIGAAAAAACDPEHLMSRADQALYRAKAAGRNQVAGG